jgi:putative phosphotransacetylase
MKKILVETSARHIHITQEHLEILCGEGYQLGYHKPLSQPGQYASDTRLEIVGPRMSMQNVIILGPVRSSTQVEISLTDARALGIKAPIRESGDINNSAPIKLKGPKGEIELNEGVIIAKRHIHMTPEDATMFNVVDRQIVAVKVVTKDRSIIYDDVVIRIRPDFALAMHIDTDESNAGGLSGEVLGEILPSFVK